MAVPDRIRQPRAAGPARHGAAEPARLWFDAEHRVAECNEAAARLLRCAPAALVGVPLTALLPAVSDAGEPAWARLAFLARCGVRFSVARPDGTCFQAALSVAHAGGADRRVPMLVLAPTNHASPTRPSARRQRLEGRVPR